MAKKTERSIRCVVTSIGKGGTPCLFPVLVHCSEDDVYYGRHYEAADVAVENESFAPCISFDEDDDSDLCDFVFGRHPEGVPEVTI